MKTTKIIILVLLSALAACSSDDSDLEETAVRIIKSDIAYEAKGGSGEITLSAPAASVTSNDSWCNVTYNGGNTATLEVEGNPLSDSRSTFVTVEDGMGNKTNVAISQEGSVLVLDNDNLQFRNNDSTATVKITSRNTDIEVKSTSAWLSAGLSGEDISISVSENTSGQGRAGIVYCCIAGTVKDSITVVQTDDSDIYGEYYMVGKDIPQYARMFPNSHNIMRMTLGKADEEDKISFSLPEYDVSIDIDYDPASRAFKIPTNAIAMKTFTLKNIILDNEFYDEIPYPDYLAFVLMSVSESGQVIGNTTINDTSPYTCDAYMTAMNDNIVWRLKNNETWTDAKVNGLMLVDFVDGMFNSYHQSGYYYQGYDIYIIKADKYTQAK